MNLTQARQAVADALSAIDGLNFRPHPTVAQPRTGDGWVVVTRLEPADFAATTATLTAVVILGADEAKAEQLVDDLGVPMLAAVTKAPDLNPADASLVQQALVAGPTGTLYALALTLTLEVD